MEIFRILLLIFIGIVLHDVYANECSNFQISPGTTVTTPGYPEVDDEYSCTAYLPFQTGGGIHAITVTDIKLYYKNWLGHEKCTMSFRVGKYNAPCISTKKECIVYYNNDGCKEIITSSYPNCISYKTSETQVKVTVTSNGDWAWAWFDFRHSKGVKMNYEYVSCLSEISTTPSSTTTTAVTSTSTTTIERTTTTTKAKTTATPSTAAILFLATTEELTTTASEQKRQSTIHEFSTIRYRSNSTSLGHGSMNQNGMTIIVAAVCSVLILILFLVIVVVLVLRRRKLRKAASTEENVHQGAIENGTAETVYSAAYGNFAHDQSNPPNQDNLYSFAAPDQSEIATYSLAHEFGQSNRRNQDTVQSENENAYSSLNHNQRVGQSSHDNAGESTSREMVENVLYGAR